LVGASSQQITLEVSSTAADTMSTSSYGDVLSKASWQPMCPHGYVVPDDPGNSRNSWVTGSYCTKACRSASDKLISLSLVFNTR
jgi:hypothetical protein